MKKTIKIFTMMAIAASMAFVGCSKDDEESSSIESLVVTFGGEEVPLGWFDAFYNGTNCEIMAARGLSETKDETDVIYPYVDFTFKNDEINDIIYIEDPDRTEPIDDDYPDIVAEWLYDTREPATYSISGLDLTALTLDRVYAKATMFDFYADYVLDDPNFETKNMEVTATNIQFDHEAKLAKRVRK